MVIERLGPNDLDKFKELRNLFIEVFQEPAPELTDEQLVAIRDNRNFVVFAATVGFELVGGMTAHIVPNYYRGGIDLFIQDLAIRSTHRRMGVASELLGKAKKFCEDHRIREMYLAAEWDDDQANAFYKSTEAEELRAIFYTYKIKSA